MSFEVNNVLTISNLSVTYGTTVALDNVSITIKMGEILGIIGPNGAGKTTLLKSVLNLVPRQSGTITLTPSSDHKTNKIPSKILKPWLHLGYVPQRHVFDWNYPLSVEYVVMSGITAHLGWLRRPRKQHWEQVYRALAQVDLFELRERPISDISGGQQQRALIARALVSDPCVLLLDEPFTGLDHPTQDSLSDLFKRLTEHGSSILMSTHDLAQAVDVCDRFAMLNHQLVAVGKPQELRNRQLWMETYQVSENSPLLRTIGLGGSEK